ncbi:Golgin subfamily A member 4-like, partial [Phytophthora palmivora]
MASAAEILAENERIAHEIHALLNANTTLEKEMEALSSERDELESLGSKKVQTLEHELETVNEELTSLRSQCQSMTEIIENDAENEIEVEEEPAPVPVSRKLSSAINQTMQRARGMSMPRQRRSSTVEMVAHGLTKAAS